MFNRRSRLLAVSAAIVFLSVFLSNPIARVTDAAAESEVTIAEGYRPNDGGGIPDDKDEGNPPDQDPGDPTPTPTPKDDDKATPTPTATKTPTPTPTAPKEEKCPYYRGSLTYKGDAQQSLGSKAFTIAKDAPKCVTDYMNNLKKRAAQKQYPAYEDDRWAFLLAGDLLGGELAKKEKNRPKVPLKLKNGATCTKIDHYHGGKILQAGEYCTAAYWIWDAACKVIQPEVAAKACGNAIASVFDLSFLKSSPISLVWKSGTDVDAVSSVVRFPLDPGSDREYALWRGSADTPLLVYDPLHRGTVDSAEQLFGNWTFGGKRTASLVTGSVLPRKWNDGYEALATLDRDGDGRIGGAELEPLALWFDENRDGVSQPGEVKSLAESGVTALFYSPDGRDELSGHITASRGFERVEHGQTIRGASVDWYAETAAAPGELVAKRFFASTVSSGEAPPAPTIPAAKLAGRGASGIWKWKFDDIEKREAEPVGYLALRIDQSGELGGYSFSSNYFVPGNELELESRMSVFFLHGNSSADRDGTKTVRFQSANGDNRLVSEATLSSDGETLTGKTKVYYIESGRNRMLEYSWTAVRF